MLQLLPHLFHVDCNARFLGILAHAGIGLCLQGKLSRYLALIIPQFRLASGGTLGKNPLLHQCTGRQLTWTILDLPVFRVEPVDLRLVAIHLIQSSHIVGSRQRGIELG